MDIKVIITGATGLVGEGVLFECLDHADVKEVLIVGRKPYTGKKHEKLKECIVADFFNLESFYEQLSGYDACLYCAGVSSRGMNEQDYSRVTFDTPMHFANTLLKLNPDMVFSHVSGGHSDSSENGKIMWARVKGRTENALLRLPFKAVYNFRPGFMKPTNGQKNIKSYYKIISSMYPVLRLLLPAQVCTMQEVGLAMINSVIKGYTKHILEIADIKRLAQSR
jgi:uncharacterized protein YbjT (DUF2867 family)